MRRLAVVQHIEFEGPGLVAEWAKTRGYQLDSFLAKEALPAASDYDLLVLMGGPMGVYDGAEFPWIETQRRWLKQAIESGVAILGFCLGAQFIADAYGAEVYKGKAGREIGYFPIQATAAAQQLGWHKADRALHWHGDTFELPSGAQRLFSSEAYENQGFIVDDRVVGLQFHWEITASGVDALLSRCADELDGSRWVQSPDSIRSGQHNGEETLYAILDFLIPA